MSEAWRAVVEYQVLINGMWEDRRWESGVYKQGSSGPMAAANRRIYEIENRYYEGRYPNVVHFKKDEVTVLTKYKEESESWKQI